MINLEKIERILLLKWGALGDIVVATPTIKTIRKAFPKAKIILLSNKLMSEIVPSGSLVDEVIIHDSQNWLKLVTFLRQQNFDLAFNFRWESDQCALLTWLSGARYRLGSGPRHLMFLYNVHIPSPQEWYHQIYRHLNFVKVLGIKIEDEIPYVYYSDEDTEEVDSFFSQQDVQKGMVLGMHPGTNKPGKTKAWPMERFIEVGKRFVNKYRTPILITWGPEEKGEAITVSKALEPYGILAPETKTINRLAVLIKNCRLYLCNCSGPMHVATAVQTPVVALLGAEHPDHWGPIGEIHRMVVSPYKRKLRDAYSENEQRIAKELITIEEVWKILDQRWEELMR